MANCKNCGSEVDGKFCSNCGQPVESFIQEPEQINVKAPIQETEQTTVTDANQLSNEEKMEILRERMNDLENKPYVDRNTKISAIIRLVIMGAIFVLWSWSAISDAITKDASLMRTVADVFAGVIFADVVWVIIKLCTLVSLPLAKGLWEELVGLGLVGFFIKIGLCLGVFLLPVGVVGALLRYISDYMQAHENTLTTILIFAVPLTITALIVWFEIRKLKK